jgi:simple sugar transport system permease protein
MMKFRRPLLRIVGSPFLSPAIAVGSAILLAVILIFFNSANPQKTFAAFFLGPWSSPRFFGNTLDGIALLLTASLGAAVAQRGGTFNLGGEGQICIGGLIASVVMLFLPQFPPVILLLLAALAAMLAGGILGGISGFLKKRLDMNELITSFLFSSALIPLADCLIKGPWRDSTGNLLALPPFQNNLLLARLLPPSNLSVSFIFALLLVFAGHIFFNRTSEGYRFRISGAVQEFAFYGGIESSRVWTPAMAASGALSSLAGFFAVAGTYGRCYAGFSGGLGWSAVAVALIAGNRPLALIPAAFIFGWLKSGSDFTMLTAELNIETFSLILAAVLLFATVRFTPLWERLVISSVMRKRND